MRLSRVLVLLCVVALLSVAVAFFFFSYANRLPAGTKHLPYLFHISSTPGIDAGTDIFRLGAVQPGGVSYRSLILGGTGDVVTVFVRGEGSEWLSVEPPSAVLPANVTITLSAPGDAAVGSYRGEILVLPGNYTSQ
jgi:hypothetical protein